MLLVQRSNPGLFPRTREMPLVMKPGKQSIILASVCGTMTGNTREPFGEGHDTEAMAVGNVT